MKRRPMPRRIVHAYFTDFAADESRVIKATDAALAAGYADEVVWIGYDGPGLPARETRSDRVELIRIPRPPLEQLPRVARRSLQLEHWGRALRAQLKALAPDLVQAHSLAALSQVAPAKAALGAPILYDAHELETERQGWSWPQRWAARRLEARVIAAADAMIVVTQSIADWYAAAYGMPAPPVVRNLPKRPLRPVTRHHLLHRELHIPPGDLIFLYLGLIDDGRGFAEIIEAFETLPKDRHAVFMGFGPAVPAVQAAHARSGNIHHKPPVPSGEVIPMAAGADVGLLTVEGSSLSYRHSLANKFFQCRGAGLPVISTDLVEHRRYLDAHGGGWILPELSGPALARQVAALDRAQIEARRGQIVEPCPYWESEEAIFLSVMERLLVRQEAAA